MRMTYSRIHNHDLVQTIHPILTVTVTLCVWGGVGYACAHVRACVYTCILTHGIIDTYMV